MTITCMYVGKKLPPEAQAIYDDYKKRIQRWAIINAVIIPSSNSKDKQTTITEESKRIANAIPTNAFVVLLDERGMSWSSPELSQEFQGWKSQQKPIVFVVGGAFGVDAHIAARANVTWSLSPLVFPHELVRIMLQEQLYRAFSIEYNLPYHHA